ncbi:hypothetical protein [Merismopedia glauca]|uniref:Uncharacterized protein n=1 Tax=Merismopedia glauca CCAP 1448/3 TaxID=1296344 RepID=A0A2T1C7M7_9CYAN|nr:hypothetical protein [Merismopedia glauca]PSB04261.1 hypothetical protein C7B64_04690 [Merismopedia glauca CCAP 1448/3]
MLYGPLYRIETDPTAIKLQIQSKEIWGKVPRNYLQSINPQVKAYTRWIGGQGSRGIKFMTDVPPDPGTPPHLALWSGDRSGVYTEGDYAKIRVTEICYYP